MEIRAWAALFLFVVTIALIAGGVLKSASATMLGASLMVLFRLLPPGQVVAAIDHNTVGLLVGMMIVVGVLSKSGIFEWIAVKAIKVTHGNGTLILWSISLVTALLSAFLDNVTTVLLVSPVVMSMCDLIGMNPLPLLLAEAFASNIGGTATLIGDPPNMIIGSFAGFSFNDFLVTLTPIVAIVQLAVTSYIGWKYHRELTVDPQATERLKNVDENKLIKDKPLMLKSTAIVVLVLLGFILQDKLGVTVSVVSLTAAGILLAFSHLDENSEMRNDVEWTTLIYFISLFVLVGGLRATGVINAVAKGLTVLLAGSRTLMVLGVLWISGIACIFINPVAYAAIFIHVVEAMAATVHIPVQPLFWSLALGCCLGGNGSYLGAAANAVMGEIINKSGSPLSFNGFLKLGIRVVLISLIISTFGILWIARASL